MEITATNIEDVKILTPKRFADARGYFAECWNKRTLGAHGINIDFVQDNESLSRDVGTLRGLHYQAPPFAQTKLVRVVAGAIQDVAVDVRIGSPSFGRSVSVEISAENGRQLLVPQGFLHGFVTLEPDTQVIYKVDNYYDGDSDGAVIWDDPNLAIDWGAEPNVLSGKDAAAPRFADWVSPFSYTRQA